MKILFVLPYVPSEIRVRPYNLLRELSRRHEITVLAIGTPQDRDEGERLRQLCDRGEILPLRATTSVGNCASAALRGEPLQAAVCRSPEMERRLADLLAEERFDLVHVEHLRAAYVAAHIPRDVPALFDAVDCISLLWERTLRASHSLRQRAVALLELGRTRAYEARTLGRYDQVTTTSHDDARALQALAPTARLSVIPNGVDLEHFRPIRGARDSATLVFSGKMSYHANVTAALHFARNILPQVKSRHPCVRLRIVGSNPPRAVKALQRDPAITATGRVPDMRAAIGMATVAVCPVTVKVGIQNKVLEAMAMGLPVVCTREGAEGLAATPGRDLLVADSPTEFARQVNLLLDDAALRDSVGQAARRFVEIQHRWDVAARELERLYLEAVDCRARLLSDSSGSHAVAR